MDDNKKLVIPPKMFKGETSVISSRLPNDMIKAIDEIAECTGRNRNEVITMCLEYAITNIDTNFMKGDE